MSMIYGLPTGVNAKMPYQPAIDEILYVEGKHTIKIDRWRIEYYSEIIKDSLQNPTEYAEGYFSLIVKLLNDPSVWEGFTEEQQLEMKSEISSMCWVITWPRPTTFLAIEVKRRRLCWTDVGCIGRSDVKYFTQST